MQPQRWLHFQEGLGRKEGLDAESGDDFGLSFQFDFPFPKMEFTLS